jgi:hypothetical protein
MNPPAPHRPPHHIHRDRAIEEVEHDPYRAKGKPPGPAVCPDCGAVFDGGRWHWGTRADGARSHVCPACLRIRERQPAGHVHLSGDYFAAHRVEILQLVRNTEDRARTDHCLERTMTLDDNRDGTRVTTTDIHLARRIGEAVYHAHGGKLDINYSPDEYRVRVTWSR